jgi:AMP-polyphosphate phosphotransferase
MLEKMDLSLSLSKKIYKERLSSITGKLGLLRRACWEAGIPFIIVFEGWDASGKGTSINTLAQYLDPRGTRIHPIKAATEMEQQMPWLWRFWLRLPNYGEIAIFDRSWYGRVVVERVEKLIPAKEWQQGYQDILDFEHTVTDDRYVLIKFFMHISKDEQKRRFKKLEKDPLQKWRVQKEDWEHHKKYDKYLEAIEEMLSRTETEWGGWNLVEATDRYWSQIKIMEVVTGKMEEALLKKNLPLPALLGLTSQKITSESEGEPHA